jgi:alpha-D-ribose 1-methylphosphonate 5-triphosphate diphosphatase
VTHAWRHVRAVTPHGVVDDATVVCEDGTIVDMVERGPAPLHAVDGRGLLLLPGLVDTHSDGLEKEITPRTGVAFPLGFALRSFESRVRAAGITTVFHGVGFQHRPEAGRSVERACEVVAAITTLQRDAGRTIDHSILFRFEALDATALDPMLSAIGDARSHLPGEPPIVSFEDHTPGQGQYRDVDGFVALLAAEDPDRSDIEAGVRAHIADAAARRHVRDANLDALRLPVINGTVRLLAHDADTSEAVDAAVASGASVAEFPVSVEAADAARRHGLPIVMGAPNALRGTSHSGNVSARELVARGMCDALASDYLPSTMLAAAFALARDGIVDLVSAVRLVTSGPAAVAGCPGRGRLDVGARADVVLVDDTGDWPVVRSVTSASNPADCAGSGRSGIQERDSRMV